MDTERLNYLINHPSEATEEDAILLKNTAEEYPYSQMLHILQAKIGFELHNENKNDLLATSAIYASSRVVLKEVIQTNTYLQNIEDVPAYQDLPIVELKEQADVQNEVLTDDQPESDSATIFDEVLKNLQKLKSLREQFLFLETDDITEKTPKKEVEKQESKQEISEPKVKKAKSKKTTPQKSAKKESPKAKKEKLDKLLEKDLELDSKVNEFFIAEISQKQEPEEKDTTDKKVFQEEIIEKFIQEQPSIGHIKKELEKSQEEITKDLSEKSTKFGDDLVSENLAVILLKQGKKERAIDIYRKLIWKLPQKKAYFAARIEEIKK